MVDQVGKIDVTSIFKSDAETAPEDTATVKSVEQNNNDTVADEAPATGKLAFMNTMKPALYKDLDRLFAKHSDDRAKLNRLLRFTIVVLSKPMTRLTKSNVPNLTVSLAIM